MTRTAERLVQMMFDVAWQRTSWCVNTSSEWKFRILHSLTMRNLHKNEEEQKRNSRVQLLLSLGGSFKDFWKPSYMCNIINIEFQASQVFFLAFDTVVEIVEGLDTDLILGWPPPKGPMPSRNPLLTGWGCLPKSWLLTWRFFWGVVFAVFLQVLCRKTWGGIINCQNS